MMIENKPDCIKDCTYSTGIVRRVDDLGRIVIPREIRRAIGVREGDPMEVFVSKNNDVILRKYVNSSKILYMVVCTFVNNEVQQFVYPFEDDLEMEQLTLEINNVVIKKFHAKEIIDISNYPVTIDGFKIQVTEK